MHNLHSFFLFIFINNTFRFRRQLLFLPHQTHLSLCIMPSSSLSSDSNFPSFVANPPLLRKNVSDSLSRRTYRPRTSSASRPIIMTTNPPKPPTPTSPSTPLSPQSRPSSLKAHAYSARLQRFLEASEEGDPLSTLLRADAAFSKFKARNSRITPPPQVLSVVDRAIPSTSDAHYDVIVAGGTLGIIYATALQRLGWRVCVVERGVLKGRTQEWYTSLDELDALLRANVVSTDQLEDAITTNCTVPGRIGFPDNQGNQQELRVGDVLNVGVTPERLVQHAAANFRAIGGVVMDQHLLVDAQVASNAVSVRLKPQRRMAISGSLGSGGTGVAAAQSGTEKDFEEETITITARLLIDAMGVFSPIAEQSRGARKPDGVCITVGSCMSGSWPSNDSPDVIYSFQPINAQQSTQYFWEAFPAHSDDSARTTYMFAYGPCDERRQTLTQAMEDYVESVEQYQGVQIDQMQVKRVVFGFFPSYFRDSPAKVAFDRVIAVGDAGGMQSPVSFGGFGCCLRQLTRLTGALDAALSGGDDKLLSRSNLQTIQSYQPSLSVTGLFNKAMQVPPGQTTAGVFLGANGINEVLWANMAAMEELGEDVQLPFLRDVVTVDGLTKTLAMMVRRNPLLALKLSAFIGAGEIIDWSRHYAALLLYAAILPAARLARDLVVSKQLLGREQRFWLCRMTEALEYGIGADVHDD